MAKIVKPVAKSVYICDDVVRDPASGKVSLLNLWDTIRVRPEDSFPYCLGKLCVFVWWRDGLGRVKTHIDIVSASTGDALRRSSEYIIEFAKRRTTVFGRYLFTNCWFPEPGEYLVEVYCEHEFVDDQIVHVLQDRGVQQ